MMTRILMRTCRSSINAAWAAVLAALLVLMSVPARAQTAGDIPAQGAPEILPDPPAEPPDAETDQEAREIYRQGDRLYAQGKYEHALEAFARSYRMSGRPRILVAMANAYERLGRYHTAARALERYAPDAPPEEEADVRERIRVLEERAAQQQAERERRLAGAASQAEGSQQRRTGWLLVGSGSAVMGAGLIFGLIAIDANSDAGTLCREARDGATLCRPEAARYFERNRTFSTLADVSFGLGAVAVLTGVAVLVLGDEDAERPVVTIGPGSLEVGIVGHF
jgi:tetratricopeptide (TPR) repeat protein